MKNKFRFRKNSIVSIIASLAILIIFNALFYSKMPAELPTHWNFQGQADDYGSKFHAMVTIQGFLVFMNLFLCFMLDNDPKNERQNNFLMTLSKMSMPIMMIVIYVITILAGLGKDINTSVIISILMGILFIAIGNYMPKIKRNYTMGIKLPWTLNSDENWRRTHRFGGLCFIFMGLCFFATPFVKSELIIIIPMAIVVVLPMIYSYYLYTKGI